MNWIRRGGELGTNQLGDGNKIDAIKAIVILYAKPGTMLASELLLMEGPEIIRFARVPQTRNRLRNRTVIINKANQFRNEVGDRTFQLAMEIANDVIPFDAHRVYCTWAESDLVWSYPSDFQDEDQSDGQMKRARNLYERLRTSDQPLLQFVQSGRCICLAKLRMPQHGEGFLAIVRQTHRASAEEGLHYGRFSKVEQYHLQKVATLLQASLANDEARQVLRRLHLNFLDRRTLLQELSFRAIRQEYLLKAADVIHQYPQEAFDGRTKGRKNAVGDVIRLTAKLMSPNNTALAIQECLSTRRNEWTRRRRAKLYFLPDRDSQARSLAARAYLTQQTQTSNRYQRDVAPEFRLFADTRRHMSAPMVAGRSGVLGVLSVESTRNEAYSLVHEAAFTLLAAHAAWPLRRAGERHGLHSFSSDLQNLRSTTTEHDFLAALSKRLQEMGYHRGMISSVDYNRKAVIGLLSWGGDQMDQVRRVTTRSFSEDRNDCQILAVRKRKPIIIKNPRRDRRTDRTALAVGELQPFGIYPILDNHGRAIWTVHLERQDIECPDKNDERFILSLGRHMMKAWEEERRARFERTWTEQMLRTSFFDLRELLCKFAECIFSQRIAVRARVFFIDETGNQQPYYQAGPFRVLQFRKVQLDDVHDSQILRAEVPVLFVEEGSHTDLKPNPEFDVLLNQNDPHKKRLRNEGRKQWVEIPVRFNQRVVAKVVLDHSNAPIDEFTLGEMRLIARLARNLSVAAETVVAYKAIAELCCRGVHYGLLRHFLYRSLTRLKHSSHSAASTLRRDIKGLLASINAIDKFFRTAKSRRSDPNAFTSVTLGQLLEYVRDACSFLVTNHHLDDDTISIPSKTRLPQILNDSHSLFLVLVTLIENACKYIRARKDAARSPSRIKESIRVSVSSDDRWPHRIFIRVADNGSGIDNATRRELSSILSDPARALAMGKLGGMTFAAFLAKEEGYQLKLSPDKRRTVFELVVQTQDAGDRL